MTQDLSVRLDQSSEIDDQVSAFLDAQLETCHCSNWLEVVYCEKVAYEHLKKAANKCAKIDNSEFYSNALAAAIAKHPLVDEEILLLLCESKYYSVWIIVAQSPYAGARTLGKLAKQSAKIDIHRGYAPYLRELVRAITRHPAANDEILSLFADTALYGVWDLLTNAACAGERTLTMLAQKLNSYHIGEDNVERLAQMILDSPKVTENVLFELSNSSYFVVWSLIVKMSIVSSRVLAKLAAICARAHLNPERYYDLAKAIAEHVNCTIAILTIMAKSYHEKISHIAHVRMHALTNAG